MDIKPSNEIQGGTEVSLRIGQRSLVIVNHITHRVTGDDPRLSLSLRFDTPWLKAGCTFANCGDVDWREWISDLGADYIGSKLFGAATRVPDYQRTVANVRGHINELRAENAITVDVANEFRRDLRAHAAATAEYPDQLRIESLLSRLMHDPILGQDGVSGFVGLRPNPAFAGFCRNVWQPLKERLQADLERENIFGASRHAAPVIEPVMEPVGMAAPERDAEPEPGF